MAGFFNLPSARSTTKKDQRLVKKMQNPTTPIAGTVTMKGSGKLVDRVQSIISILSSKFASKKDKLCLITKEEDLVKYIDACIENNRISIDTETTGLDPILHDIVGFSIYTKGQKAAYIPINHVSYVTDLPIANQLSVEFIRDQFKRLIDAKTRTYWFNAPFDVRFIGNHIGVWFTPYFDASIASRIMNSEEPVKKLKPLHIKYCCGGVGDSLTFDKLFDGVPFQYIPPNYGYLYAASDALYTDELSAYYEQFLDPDGIYYEGNEGLSNVFYDIEMRSMPTFISMEQAGVAIDYAHADKISTEYHDLADKMGSNIEKVCEQYKDKFDDYRRKHPMCKLTDPINFNSPVQLAIILYDIFKIPPPDKRNPRGTGEEILEKIDHPICKAILDNRSFGKVLSTYIDKIPEQAQLYPDKRIHCKFNQYGASTGRVSSNSPNLQNIPSNPFKLSDGTKIDSGHDVRQLFTASPGHILMSCDYSGQEVRVCAHLSNDKKMIQAYRDGKDVYSEIASLAFNQPYEECCEFRKDGTTNPDGKARRGSAKKIVLGVLYGRGIPSIAEQLGTTVQEAQKIYDKVLDSFDGLAKFIEESEDMARKYGYVTTVWGRRRQLPDMQLPWYEFKYKDGVNPNFDPLSDDEEYATEVPYEDVEYYTNKLLACKWYKQREELKEKIRSKGIVIKDNTHAISEARRQCVNARVQGRSVLPIYIEPHYSWVCCA